jgi:hypothetical protein
MASGADNRGLPDMTPLTTSSQPLSPTATATQPAQTSSVTINDLLAGMDPESRLKLKMSFVSETIHKLLFDFRLDDGS